MFGPQLGEYLVSGSALATFGLFQPFSDCRANLDVFRVSLVYRIERPLGGPLIVADQLLDIGLNAKTMGLRFFPNVSFEL